MHLIRTAANAPKSLTGQIYGLTSAADIDGAYTTTGAPTATSYVLQNGKGVRVELAPAPGGARLPTHDAAHPVTIKLSQAATP